MDILKHNLEYKADAGTHFLDLTFSLHYLFINCYLNIFEQVIIIKKTQQAWILKCNKNKLFIWIRNWRRYCRILQILKSKYFKQFYFIYRGRNENIDKFFWKYRQIFLKISTNFFENIDKIFKKYRQNFQKISTKFSKNIDKIFKKYRQNFQKISTKFSKNIDKIFKKYRQNFQKISTKFSKNIDNFFNKYNLACWFYICDLALKIVFWLK